MKPRCLHVVVAVWGSPHVERWACHSLRTQLSAGNLPALARRGVPIQYHVFSDAASLPSLRAATVPLARYAEVCLHAIEDTELYGGTFARHMQGADEAEAKRRLDAGSVAWVVEHAAAAGGEAVLCLLTNDLIVSDGALEAAWDKLERGAKAVMVPVLRLESERTGWPADGPPGIAPGEPGIGARALCEMLQDGLHSMSRRLDAASPRFSHYPTSVLWRVGDEGWLCRSFMPHPLMVVSVPGRWHPHSTVDYTLALAMHPEEGDVRMPGPEDDIVVLKRTPRAVYDESTAPAATLTPAHMARFLYFCTSRAHRALARQPVRLRARTTPGAQAAWAAAEASSRGELDRWYEHLDVHGTDIDLRGSGVDRLWHASHYAPIEYFLCPGRIWRESRQYPALKQIWELIWVLHAPRDIRAQLARHGYDVR